AARLRRPHDRGGAGALIRRDALRSAAALVLGAAARAQGSEPQAGPDPSRGSPPTPEAIPDTAVALEDFEPLARERVPRMAYEYICGGAADELSLRANRTAFERIRVKPRVLVDVSRLDTRVTLFGQELSHPILLAPTAYHRLFHPEGELATVRGAGDTGTTFVVSSF